MCTASGCQSEHANYLQNNSSHIQCIECDNYHANFSKRNLEEVPQCILKDHNFLKFLYLNDNSLNKLPECLFQHLKCLKWLDARNNQLTEIPQTVKNHPTLEVLLLQGNRIKKLPLELGLVPNLRGIQLAGNPIEFPPQNVLDQGIKYIQKFLNEEWKIKSESDIRPIVEPFYKKSIDTEDICETNAKYRRIKSKSAFAVNGYVKCSSPASRRLKTSLPSLSVVSYCPESEAKQLLVPTNSPTGIVQCEAVCFKKTCQPELVSNASSMYRKNKSAISLKRCESENKIYETLLRDLWITKIKFILEKQNEIIQKRRDSETLHGWRKDTDKLKLINRIHLENFKKNGLTIPFDTDDDYMKILSRSELRNSWSRGGSLKSLTVSPIMKSVSQEMSEILSVLDRMCNRTANTTLTPRSRQRASSDDIKTLQMLEKRLHGLRLKPPAEDDLKPLSGRTQTQKT